MKPMNPMKRALRNLAAALFLGSRERQSPRIAGLVEQTLDAFKALDDDTFPLILDADHAGRFNVDTAHATTALDALLSGEKDLALAAHLKRVFADSALRRLIFLEVPTLQALAASIRLIARSESHLGLHLIEHRVYSVLTVSAEPTLRVDADVSHDVAEALDTLFLIMMGIDRYGMSGHAGPDVLLGTVARFLVEDLRVPEAQRELIAQLDLVLDAFPDEVQEGVRELFVAQLADDDRSLLMADGVIEERLFSPPRRGPPEDSERTQEMAAAADPTVPVPVMTRDPGAVGLGSRVDGTEDWMTSYREFGPQLLRRAEQLVGREGYRETILGLATVARALVDAGDTPRALPIASLVVAHRARALSTGAGAGKAVFDEAERILFDAHAVEGWIAELPDATFVEQCARLTFLPSCGPAVIPILARLLTERHLAGTLKSAVIGTLETFGREAGPYLLEALRSVGLEGFSADALMGLLGAVGCTESREDLLTAFRHPDPRVRRPAIAALYKLLGRESETYLVAALDDDDASICQRALTLLGVSGSADAHFIMMLEQLLSAETPDDVREEGVAITAIRTLRFLGNITFPSGRTAEEILLTRLGVRPGARKIARRRTLGRNLSLRVKAAIIETLGAIGTVDATAALGHLSEENSPVIRHHAGHAQRAIRGRGG